MGGIYSTSKVRFVHLFSDLKFIKAAQSTYEAAMPGLHVFIYLAENDDEVASDLSNVICVKKRDQRHLGRQGLIRNADFLCLHWITISKIRIANDFGRYDRIIPFIWGADLYPIFSSNRRGLFLPETERLIKGNSWSILRCHWLEPFLLARICYRKFRWLTEWKYRRFYRKLCYCVPVIQQDGELLQQTIGKELELIEHNYTTNEMAIADLPSDSMVCGDNILLGNSAARTNNHADMLKILANVDLGESQVFTPLSYADQPPYADTVEKVGYELVGESFRPLRGFMPSSEYFETIFSCRYVIMPILRQQAGGVTRRMIYAGSTVFLFKENYFWEYYANIGVKLVSLEEFIKNPVLEAHRISDQEAQSNRRIVEEHFSTEKVVARAQAMFSTFIKSQ